MVTYYLFRFAGLISPHIPDRLGYALCDWMADLIFLVPGGRFKVYFSNLRRVLGDQASPSQIKAIARRAFRNQLKNYFDLFRAHGLSPDRLRAQAASIQGMEYMQNALAQGKGVVAGSPHFGTWDMILQLAAVFLKTEIVVPNERLKPEKLNQYILDLRAGQGITMVPIDLAPRALIKAVKSGHVAGIAYDRDITKTGPIVQFFGSPTHIPDGPVQLSLKYGCPVIMGFSIRQPDNRSRVIIEPPLLFTRTGDNAADVCQGVQKMAAVMERYIRQYPDQWLMFQPFWNTDN